MAHIRWRYKHLPANGVLLFFDVKPVVVKAYGGRRYTTAKRLVLEKGQKTRGRFYLYLCYNAEDGKLHWAYYPKKSSEYVCRFMQRIRGEYPGTHIWIVLDQDPAHPRKSRRAQSCMRDLNLHWISLPKRSPDDNPVENIFSDIQQNILSMSATMRMPRGRNTGSVLMYGDAADESIGESESRTYRIPTNDR